MENNTTPKKEMYDENGGFIFMQKWPAVIRWILVLPIALLSFILVNGFSNWALKITSAEWFLYTVSFIFHTIATGIFIFNGAAAAPSGRKIVKIILAVIMLLSAVVIFTIPQEKVSYADLSPTLKIINLVSVVLGVVWVFFDSRKQNKV
ncbi:hypothetical protein [Soonwooa sp.]|uniref:hypothetical protein n=1 Tax=Soonwooa sp. TaxID=1938592 RepID=UPI002619539D|nr:hypothetical protein [Soonwooa sp.]